jgi:hypothetical protein
VLHAESAQPHPRLPAPAPGRWRAHRALLRDSDADLKRRLGVRAGTLVTLLVALGFSGAVVMVSADGAPSSMAGMMSRALWLLSVLGVTPAAVSFAGYLSLPPSSGGSAQLALLRGLDRKAQSMARFHAGCRRLVGMVLFPALLLGVLAALLSDDAGEAALRVGLAIRSAGYAAVLGVTLAGLAWAAARLVPARPRLAFAALLVVPHLARALWPSTPSVPALLAWFLEAFVRGAFG